MLEIYFAIALVLGTIGAIINIAVVDGREGAVVPFLFWLVIGLAWPIMIFGLLIAVFEHFNSKK